MAIGLAMMLAGQGECGCRRSVLFLPIECTMICQHHGLLLMMKTATYHDGAAYSLCLIIVLLCMCGW